MEQRMVFDGSGKLIAHLRCHERMGDLLALEIVVQRNEVEAYFLWNDVHRSTTSQCRIHVHHASIKAVGSVCSHTTSSLQFNVTLIPMAVTNHIAMTQLATLRHTSRARSIEQDIAILRSNV